MDEIREQALDEVLTALPTVENPVLSCVQMCTSKPEDISFQKIKSIMIPTFAEENQDDLDQIKKSFYEKKDKKENVNESILIDVLTDVMCDGIQLFDDEELAALTLKSQ